MKQIQLGFLSQLAAQQSPLTMFDSSEIAPLGNLGVFWHKLLQYIPMKSRYFLVQIL
jgi:hypothetical protein